MSLQMAQSSGRDFHVESEAQMRILLRNLAAVLVVMTFSGCAIRMGPIDKGFRHFERAQSCVADQVRKNQPVTPLSCEDYVIAETEFKEALADDEDNPYAQLNLGAVYQNTGRPQLAIPLYQKVLETGKDVRPTRKANSEKADKEKKDPTLAELAQANLSILGIAPTSR